MQKILGWILFIILLINPGPVLAQLADKSFALNEVGTSEKESHVKGQLIIKFKSVARDAALAQFTSENQIVFEKSIQGVDADLFNIPEEMEIDAVIAKIKADPNVEYVEPNYYLWPTATPNDTLFTQQWGLKNNGQEVRGRRGTAGADIEAPAAWNIAKGGRNVIVAVIDTGVEIFHPDIAPNRWYNTKELQGAGNLNNWRPNGVDDDGNGYVDDVVGWDFVYRLNNPRDLSSGHGTHVAGIAAASGNNGRGVAGVSWRSRIMPLAVQDYRTGGLPISAIVEALVYAQKMGAKVVNMSFGAYGVSQTLQNAINQVKTPVLCAAAGNEGLNNDVSQHIPSNYTNANLIAVAATDQSDRLASFSNFGKANVDVAAPGVSIVSTYIKGSGYAYGSGTSMASPMVAGIAALVISRRPGLTANQTVSILRRGVETVDTLSGRVSTGGRVSALKALTIDSGGGDGGGGGGGCFIDALRSKSR